MCAIAVTEPDTGSDVAAMRLKATKCEGGWILDGVKTWCTMAGKAGVLLVLARSNPDRSLGHKGLSERSKRTRMTDTISSIVKHREARCV